MPVDFIQRTDAGVTGYGSVAEALLQSDFSINALRHNAVLRKEEWIQFDEAVVNVARNRLVAVGEMIQRGLTFNIPNALGTTVLEWEQVSDMTPADVSMSGVTDGEEGRLAFTLKNMPLPIIHKDFRVHIRALEASRKLGQSLDVAQASMASTLVSEQVESIFYLGSTVTGGSGTVYGITNEPNRNTGSVAANWDTTATGAQYVADVIAMIDKANTDNHYGPYLLHVTYAAWNRMMDDFKANSDKTTVQRIMEIPGIEKILPSRDMPANNVVLQQLSQDVADIVDGMQPTTVQWESRGGMMVHFKVMAIILPRVRSTVESQSGIVHYS